MAMHTTGKLDEAALMAHPTNKQLRTSPLEGDDRGDCWHRPERHRFLSRRTFSGSRTSLRMSSGRASRSDRLRC